jgi:hypothetical protein
MHRDALSQGRLQGIYQSINKPTSAASPGEYPGTYSTNPNPNAIFTIVKNSRKHQEEHDHSQTTLSRQSCIFKDLN